MTVEVITSAGTWICPEGVFSVQVEAWGSGGLGANGGANGGGGGGGGAYSLKNNFPTTPGASYTVQMSSGGDTYFDTPTTCFAQRGFPGSAGSPGSGGQSSAGFGDVRFSGGSGAAGTGPNSGGGGSSAGTSANGNSATGSLGGTAPAGGGSGSNGTAGTNSPNAGDPGGGSGGTSLSGVPGNPGLGKIVLTYEESSSVLLLISQIRGW